MPDLPDPALPPVDAPAAEDVLAGVPTTEEILAGRPSREEVLDGVPSAREVIGEQPAPEDVVTGAVPSAEDALAGEEEPGGT